MAGCKERKYNEAIYHRKQFEKENTTEKKLRSLLCEFFIAPRNSKQSVFLHCLDVAFDLASFQH